MRNNAPKREVPTTRTSHRLADRLGLSLAANWRDGRIVSLDLVAPSPADSVAEGALGLWIASWNDGQPSPGIPEDLLDWTGVPLRTRQILSVLTDVPAGRTTSYGELAARAGIPKGYQAVGQAMARNPFVLLVPCHRVLTRDGGLGGYSAGGPAVKRRLLEQEGWSS